MDHKPKKVSIVVLNYKNAQDTISCIESIAKISYREYSLIIVDNASPDESLYLIYNYLKEQYADDFDVFFAQDDVIEKLAPIKKATLIQASLNGGYGYGINIGIKYAVEKESDYVLMLNNDTIVAHDFLEPLVDMCEDNTKIGLISGRIYFYDKPDTIWFNGGTYDPCYSKVKHANFNEKYFGQLPPKKISFITGCMCMIPKRVIEEVGFINEDYFMYIEDLEYSQRVLRKGYMLSVCCESNVWHRVGRSTGGRFSEFSVYWRTLNMNSFIFNHHYSLLCKIIGFFIYNITSFLALLRNGKFALINTYKTALIKSIDNIKN